MFAGKKIRKIRQEQQLSLQELSNNSGVSVAMISQIEREKADPTMTTLYKICKGLNITIISLFEEQDESKRVLRKDERKTILLKNSKVKYQLLSPSSKTNLEMLLVELEPGQEDRQLITHSGEECGFVIEGKLTIVLGEEEFLLNTGDSIHFSSSLPHRFINHSKKRSVSVWAMTPPSF